jgi:hypothetical protein
MSRPHYWGFSEAMSGGTEKRDRAGYGTLRADGALAISHKKESAIGNFRAVINGPLGDEFEAKVLCFANCYVYVRLFFCVGRPDEDTCSVSGNVWSYPLSGTHVYVCGNLPVVRADLAIAHGDILRLRYVRACGTVDARINSRSEVRLFDGVFGDELYAGFFLGDHSRVRLLEIMGALSACLRPGVTWAPLLVAGSVSSCQAVCVMALAS